MMMPTPTQEPDPRLARTRAVVLDAATEVLARHGTEGFTVDAVVARSGVAKTTIYRHWPTKEGLLLAAMACFARPESAPDTGTLRGDLVALLGGLAHALADEQWSKSLPAMLERAEHHPDLAAQHLAIVQLKTAPLIAIVERGRERGEIRADIDIDLVPALFCGPLFFRRLMMRKSTSTEQVESLVDSLLAGLAG
jgi:AcrR family transcriptional regulator